MKISQEGIEKIKVSQNDFKLATAKQKAAYAAFEVAFTEILVASGVSPEGVIVCMDCGEVRPEAQKEKPCICKAEIQKPQLVPAAQ